MYKFGQKIVSSLKRNVYNPFALTSSSSDSNSAIDFSPDESAIPPGTCTPSPSAGRKRSRCQSQSLSPTPCSSGSGSGTDIDSADETEARPTPTLVHPNSVNVNHSKRRRLDDADDNLSVTVTASLDAEQFAQPFLSPPQKSLLLEMIPQDVMLANIFAYLTDSKDHYSLQLTCRKFHEVSNKPEMLSQVNLTGEAETGKGSILHGVDSPDEAMQKLYKFSAVGNQQAMYKIGMVAAYCHGDKVGVNLLKQNARNGCLRSAYTLGLILRDCDKKESNRYLNLAISKDYLPACQELLSSQAVKDKFGDLDYQTLKQYFDPIALNRLLGRSYLQSSGVRGVSTSHCWNPCCGRWALKATQNHQRGPQLQFSSKYLPPISPNVEFTLLNLLDDDFKKEQGCGSINFPRSRRERSFRVSRMKMCSSCRRAKYCSKLCQVYDWRSGQHKMECQFL